MNKSQPNSSQLKPTQVNPIQLNLNQLVGFHSKADLEIILDFLAAWPGSQKISAVKRVISREKIQNFRRKGIKFELFYTNSKKLFEKMDNLQHFTNTFDKSRNIFKIISANLNNFLQLGC